MRSYGVRRDRGEDRPGRSRRGFRLAYRATTGENARVGEFEPPTLVPWQGVPSRLYSIVRMQQNALLRLQEGVCGLICGLLGPLQALVWPLQAFGLETAQEGFLMV